MSCKFRILLMPRKKELRNPLTFHANADPGVKCEVKKGAKREKRNTIYLAIHLSFFAFRKRFRIFRNKCIADLKHRKSLMNMNS